MSDIVRLILLLMHGKYNRVQGHFVKTEFQRYSNMESQGSSSYRCLDCGESHRRKYEFSEKCSIDADSSRGENRE